MLAEKRNENVSGFKLLDDLLFPLLGDAQVVVSDEGGDSKLLEGIFDISRCLTIASRVAYECSRIFHESDRLNDLLTCAG